MVRSPRPSLFRLAFAGIMTALMLTASSIHAEEKAKIAISGSDTMNVLSQRLAEVYMKQSPNVEISVRGGGSGVGISDLIGGLNDIAQSSRKMKPEEIEKAKANGYAPEEHIVALDGIAIAVNAENPVKELSLSQLKAIYTGTVKKWNELDPSLPAENITLISRESNCGTYDFFKEHVMKKADFANDTKYLAATAAIADAVKTNKFAIGYGGVAYFVRPEGIRVVSVKESKESAAVNPIDAEKHHVNLAVIQDGSYPISRPLQYYTPDAPEGQVKAFLDWAKGDEGQKIVLEQEYIPLVTGSAAAAGH